MNQRLPSILNSRYRLDKAKRSDRLLPVGDDDFAARIKRYTLCSLDGKEEPDPGIWRGRSGFAAVPSIEEHQRFIKGGWSAVSPEHARGMQRLLVERLGREYPGAEVVCEENFVDVLVRTPDGTILFEIKSDLSPLSVIRQGLGQLLEYAFHPRRPHQPPVSLVVVGRRRLEGADLSYFEFLKQRFSLPIDYWEVPL